MNQRRNTPEPRFRIDFPPELPISSRAGDIVAAIQESQVLILAGETGSGKTTQIPKMCLAAGRGRLGRIACTQPRRVAALSLSRRVAEELGVEWGQEVGCKVRFSDETTSRTVIKFLTDGMLLAEAQGDPQLRDYDTIVVDEAHERSLNIDFLLGHLRQLRFSRPELRIVITSATIDTDAFSRAFEGAPVIQVEGRTFPVETRYAPLDALGSDASEEDDRESRAEALHYVDGAVQQSELLAAESTGDILIFMPSERDIRETCELLGGRLRNCDIIPLFGRLSNSEQQRIFARGGRRKVVVATNIAETSLTIPGIRYVVDTGLARVSRYAPQSRTRRLPIEPVSQSSADQRKGRCGRMADGVCVRLYSEEDYLARARFTQPEIQRANLADVILRLQASGLGDVERFPFISPPSPKAVQSGYSLLEELGAIQPSQPGLARKLTAIGHELGRLPVDPTVARMILQARTEKAVREVLVIASGLSIQDPRERPLEKRAQADAAHRRFLHPDSDFLTLLNIWQAFHNDVETLSQSRLRAFCKGHFLSYIRMREWRDVHLQLLDVLRERKDFRLVSVFDGAQSNDPAALGFGLPAYRAIHRSILAGLLGNIGQRDEEGGGYRMAHDRKAVLFPGSALHVKDQEKKNPKKTADSRKSVKGPRWIMAAEIMETSRIYARTCARIDPVWALDLGAHLCRVAHLDPFWNAESGRVMVKQKTRLCGLEIDSRSVGYGRINPAAATEIFIREGLVNDTVTWPFDFLTANRRLREKTEALLTRARNSAYLNLDEAIYRFYAARIPAVSAVAELVDLVRERRGAEPQFLIMRSEDLREAGSLDGDSEAFPEALPMENRALPLHYAYKPGSEDDGVTLEVGFREVASLSEATIDWAVPGHIEERVEHGLRNLPKDLRRSFVPLGEAAKRLAAAAAIRSRLTAQSETLAQALSASIRELHGIGLDPKLFLGKPLPDHLRVRIRVVDDQGGEICSSRDLNALKAELEAREREAARRVASDDPEAWNRARQAWEKPEQEAWGFGEIRDRVIVAEKAGLPVYAYPGLKEGERGVALRLFRTIEEASAATRLGLFQLTELQLRRDLAWLHKDLRVIGEIGPLAATLKPGKQLWEDAFLSIRTWACGKPVAPLTSLRFEQVLAETKEAFRPIPARLNELLREILALRQELLVHPHPYPGLASDLNSLVPADVLRATPFAQLPQLPRYLKGMRKRADRWSRDSAKDAERARQLAPYVRASGKNSGDFRWMVEEFRISLFAQELGTSVPVSAVKLDRMLAGEDTIAPRPPEIPPRPAAPVPSVRPKATLKSLEALGRIDPRRS